MEIKFKQTGTVPAIQLTDGEDIIKSDIVFSEKSADYLYGYYQSIIDATNWTDIISDSSLASIADYVKNTLWVS